jgi:hypothetical protein
MTGATFTILGFVLALLLLPGWAAVEIVRRCAGRVRWSGLAALFALPLVFYAWECREIAIHNPSRFDGAGIKVTMVQAAVLAWWLSAAIGLAAGFISLHVDRADREEAH